MFNLQNVATYYVATVAMLCVLNVATMLYLTDPNFKKRLNIKLTSIRISW